MRYNLDTIISDCIYYVEKNNYASYDPYDALTSKMLDKATGKHSLIRRVLIQINLKSIINFRPIFGINKRIHTKTISDFITIYALNNDYSDNHYNKLNKLYSILLECGIDIDNKKVWGLRFPYTSRFTNANYDTPNLYNTLNSGLAILDYYDATKDDNVEIIIDNICEYITNNLGMQHLDENTIWIRYYPNQSSPILNVNATTAHFFLRANKTFKKEKVNHITISKIINLLKTYQNDNGSWYYSIDDKGKWIDGFHTGFIIDSLIYIYNNSNFDIKKHLTKGISFYIDELFNKKGLPKYYYNSQYPIESQNCAQAIYSLSKIIDSGLYSDKNLLEKTIEQTVKYLYNKKGYFIHKKTKLFNYNHIYFRWSQTPMILALISAKKTLSN